MSYTQKDVSRIAKNILAEDKVDYEMLQKNVWAKARNLNFDILTFLESTIKNKEAFIDKIHKIMDEAEKAHDNKMINSMVNIINALNKIENVKENVKKIDGNL